VPDAAHSNTDGFLQEIHLFFHVGWIGICGTQWAFSHVETFNLQEVFLSNTKSVLTGKQCTSAPTSNTDGFPCRDSCLSTTLLKVPICLRVRLPSLWKYDLHEVFLSKTTSTLTRNQWGICCSFELG
jgi:hypothetical protein